MFHPAIARPSGLCVLFRRYVFRKRRNAVAHFMGSAMRVDIAEFLERGVVPDWSWPTSHKTGNAISATRAVPKRGRPGSMKQIRSDPV